MTTILIRAEDKNRWERRTPIVPADLAEIVKKTGAGAFVEKSDKRFFPWKAMSPPAPSRARAWVRGM